MMQIENLNMDMNLLLEKLRDLGLFIHDLEQNRAYPNRLWKSWGYGETDMLKYGFLELVHPEDRAKVQAALARLEGEEGSWNSVLFRIRTRDGSWRWVHSISISVIRNDEGHLQKYVGFDFDVTEEMEARHNAERHAIEAQTLMDASAAVVTSLELQETIGLILDHARKVVPFSSASVQIFDGKELEIVGGRGFKADLPLIGVRFPIPGDNPNTRVIMERKIVCFGPEIVELYPQFKKLSYSDMSGWMGVPLLYQDRVVGMISFDRRQSGTEAEKQGFNSRDEELAAAFSVYVAIALQNSRMYEEVRLLSITDPLTSCYTRRWMYQVLDHEAELAQRHGHELSLIMFDIDNFKAVNDSLGHVAGDAVLKEVSQKASQMLRKTDTLCRFGGEEFVVILPHSNEQAAYEVAERIRQSVWEAPLEGMAVSISLGCAAMIDGDIKNIDRFINRVDQALLSAKAAGKNRTLIASALTPSGT